MLANGQFSNHNLERWAAIIEPEVRGRKILTPFTFLTVALFGCEDCRISVVDIDYCSRPLFKEHDVGCAYSACVSTGRYVRNRNIVH